MLPVGHKVVTVWNIYVLHAKADLPVSSADLCSASAGMRSNGESAPPPPPWLHPHLISFQLQHLGGSRHSYSISDSALPIEGGLLLEV